MEKYRQGQQTSCAIYDGSLTHGHGHEGLYNILFLMGEIIELSTPPRVCKFIHLFISLLSYIFAHDCVITSLHAGFETSTIRPIIIF